MAIKPTHDIEFFVNIPKHGVPEGGSEVVTQGFYGVEGRYRNCPIEMVLKVQAQGVKFLEELVKLGEEYHATKVVSRGPGPSKSA